METDDIATAIAPQSERPHPSLSGNIRNVRLADIPSDAKNRDLRVFHRVPEIFMRPADKVVINPDLCHIFFQQLIH